VFFLNKNGIILLDIYIFVRLKKLKCFFEIQNMGTSLLGKNLGGDDPMLKEKVQAKDIAMWLIKNKFDKPRNTYDGNMKLQKLLYFSQLINLALYGEVLFEDDILAFKNGCVIEEIRLAYRDNYRDFTKDAESKEFSFSPGIMDTLNMTVSLFGNINARELSGLNHSQKSWEDAFNNSDCSGFYCKEGAVVSVESIMKKDIQRVKEIVSSYKQLNDNFSCYEIINGIKFFYNPHEITLDETVVETLESFCGEDEAYTIYNDERLGLVIV